MGWRAWSARPGGSPVDLGRPPDRLGRLGCGLRGLGGPVTAPSPKPKQNYGQRLGGTNSRVSCRMVTVFKVGLESVSGLVGKLYARWRRMPSSWRSRAPRISTELLVRLKEYSGKSANFATERRFFCDAHLRAFSAHFWHSNATRPPIICTQTRILRAFLTHL